MPEKGSQVWIVHNWQLVLQATPSARWWFFTVDIDGFFCSSFKTSAFPVQKLNIGIHKKHMWLSQLVLYQIYRCNSKKARHNLTDIWVFLFRLLGPQWMDSIWIYWTGEFYVLIQFSIKTLQIESNIFCIVLSGLIRCRSIHTNTVHCWSSQNKMLSVTSIKSDIDNTGHWRRDLYRLENYVPRSNLFLQISAIDTITTLM